ncbi:unnamed protein product [Ceratitis capitata]|uniref:(Mediterranean fruit fly) hypothetical protein n=1 Tax=Ceratitis capitata TaxID=7213 RepID=A0A811UIV0_CERCA|nr:unnamed protein product [Ceratitis capitata]
MNTAQRRAQQRKTVKVVKMVKARQTDRRNDDVYDTTQTLMMCAIACIARRGLACMIVRFSSSRRHSSLGYSGNLYLQHCVKRKEARRLSEAGLAAAAVNERPFLAELCNNFGIIFKCFPLMYGLAGSQN